MHWHGLAPPNAMDGVPGLTQRPVAPGADFLYEFPTPVAGSFMYRAHVGVQLDRGLYGPLAVEPRHEPLSYDREYTLMLDDWADGPHRHAGHGGGEAPAPPAVTDPAALVSFGGRRYPLLLVNGRPPQDPTVVEGRR